MKDHPDYKYRPRRKPKPLIKKEMPRFPFSFPFIDPVSRQLINSYPLLNSPPDRNIKDFFPALDFSKVSRAPDSGLMPGLIPTSSMYQPKSLMVSSLVSPSTTSFSSTHSSMSTSALQARLERPRLGPPFHPDSPNHPDSTTSPLPALKSSPVPQSISTSLAFTSLANLSRASTPIARTKRERSRSPPPSSPPTSMPPLLSSCSSTTAAAVTKQESTTPPPPPLSLSPGPSAAESSFRRYSPPGLPSGSSSLSTNTLPYLHPLQYYPSWYLHHLFPSYLLQPPPFLPFPPPSSLLPPLAAPDFSASISKSSQP